MDQGPALPGHGRDEDPARDAGEPGQTPEGGTTGEWRLLPSGPGKTPPGGNGRWRPLPSGPDWMDDAEWAASLLARESSDEPNDPDLDPDPEDPPPPGEDDISAELIAECREVSAEEARAAARIARLGHTGAMAALAAALGRRGPGMPGSADRFPGEYPGPAAGFATGHPLDAAPGCAALLGFAEDAAGDDDSYDGATDDQIVGVICAWDRVEAHVAARKHAAVAELIR